MRSQALAALLGTVLATACAADGPDAAPTLTSPTPAAPAPLQPTPTPTRAPPTPTPVEDADASDGPCADPLGCYGQPVRAGTFDAETVPEASGLAASRRNPGLLYLLDDRPGTSEVWVIGVDGGLRGAIAVAGLDARDTESLAVGPCAPGTAAPCVYVGDIGDNLRVRDDIRVHRFPEPDLGAGVPAAPVDADSVRWTYPDGPHDAEALLVDDAGVVLIVTKAPFDADTGETGDARLYRAPAFADGVLEDLGFLPVPPPEAPVHSLFVGNVVTGADYRDGRVLLRTYDQVLEYRAPAQGADLATLSQWGVRALPSPLEPQSEAIAWAADGCGFYTAGEVVGDLWHVPCIP